MMNERLQELYRGVAVHATADLEHQAAMELLVLVMLADEDITDGEIDMIREISGEWRGSGDRFEEYLRPAIERARRAVQEDQIAPFLDRVDERISSRILRRELFSAAREVAGIDKDVHPVEGSILAEVAVRFG